MKKEIKDLLNLKNKIILTIDDYKYSSEKIKTFLNIINFNFNKLKINRNKKFFVLMENGIEYYLIYLFSFIQNIKIIPLDTGIQGHTLASFINKLNTNYIFVSPTYYERINTFNLKKIRCINFQNLMTADKNFKNNSNIFTNYNIRTPYIYSLTSGTTNDPKIIQFSRTIKAKRAKHAVDLYKLKKNKEVIVLSSPMYHSISQRLIFLSILLNSTLCIQSTFNKIQWIKIARANLATFSILPSSLYSQVIPELIKSKNKDLKISNIVSCCSPLDEKVKKLIKNTKTKKIKFFDTYGASEVGTVTNYNIKVDNFPHNFVGFITKGNNVIIDKKESGKILCSSLQSHLSYFNYPKKKFYDLGDYGYLKGTKLFLSGRNVDKISISGGTIFLTDIEKTLEKCNLVDKCLVVNFYNIKKNNILIAYFILKKQYKNKIDSSLRLIKLFALKNLNNYQLPLDFKILTDLPVNSLGKISKRFIKESADKKITDFYKKL